MTNGKPKFIIKKNLQKSNVTGTYFSDSVTIEVLKDVCIKITGTSDFEYEYVDNDYKDDVLEATYNKGRLAILYYNSKVAYISFSEIEINGRNSSVQSVPTAFNQYYMNGSKNKELYYYFLNSSGNAETDYHILIYRLMKTIGFVFINESVLKSPINPFTSVEDLMNSRKINTSRNRSNNSTYITKSTSVNIDIYGKTYGASKYETSMICYALSILAKQNHILTLYEVLEQNLKELPKASLDVLINMGNIRIIPTSLILDKKNLEKNANFRSPRYIYNLFNRIGSKKCALCDCEIPELIQGAHIWPVSQIKRANILSIDDKLKYALDGNNGIWLCENHHKLFDENIINISTNLVVEFDSKISDKDRKYLSEITKVNEIEKKYVTNEFIFYLEKRRIIV